jgi:hypothetical protein
MKELQNDPQKDLPKQFSIGEDLDSRVNEEEDLDSRVNEEEQDEE